jgi:hypothetical protein
MSPRISESPLTWLSLTGISGSYIKQKMRFFVAKVNLDHMPLLANGYLRPLQVRYETAKFMLPLRLGTVTTPPLHRRNSES